jgi:hypothetical protein
MAAKLDCLPDRDVREGRASRANWEEVCVGDGIACNGISGCGSRVRGSFRLFTPGVKPWGERRGYII